MSVTCTTNSFESKKQVSNDAEDDSSSLSGYSDEDNFDEYFEDELIPDDCSDVSSVSSNGLDNAMNNPGNFEKKYAGVDSTWKSEYMTQWRSYSNTTEHNFKCSFPADTTNPNSSPVSATPHPPKKRLTVDADDVNLSRKSGGTFFTSFGNWFRGSKQPSKNAPDLTKVDPSEKSTTVINTDNLRPTVEVGTSFSFSANNPVNGKSPKKVIHFSPPLHSPDLSNSLDSADDDRESSSTESFCSKSIPAVSGATNTSDMHHASCEVVYEFYTSDKQQHSCFHSHFKKTPGVTIVHKPVDNTLVADALIVPGNSFGFLDGEPEIQYVKLFGWSIQKRLRQIICDQHGGELLVGESVILPLTKSEATSDATDSADDRDASKVDHWTITPEQDAVEEKEFCRTIRNLIYVPVMRVPSLVQDTVNAYLAFRAAIRAVKTHNLNCDEAERIGTVACPVLCSDIGRMPSGRIALQMKTAYDAFAMDRRRDLREPTDLGHLATNHVEMSTAKNGNWC